jgi:hypothetical protein
MSGNIPQLLKKRCFHFLKPNIDSSTVHTVAVDETTAASGAEG